MRCKEQKNQESNGWLTAVNEYVGQVQVFPVQILGAHFSNKNSDTFPTLNRFIIIVFIIFIFLYESFLLYFLSNKIPGDSAHWQVGSKK